MIKNTIKSTNLICSLTLLSFALFVSVNSEISHAAEPAKAKSLKVHNNAKPIEKITPEYPALASRRKLQGWVVADIDVAEDGTVAKVNVLNSFGEDVFIEAGVEALQNVTYKVKNNKSTQYMSNVRVDFAKNGKRPLSASFGRKYKKINEMLNKDELTEALSELESISFDKLDNIQEVNVALSLWALYGRKTDNKHLQLHYLKQMNFNKNRDNADFMFGMLKQQIVLQVGFNHLIGVKRTFDELKNLKPAKRYLPAFKKVIKQVDAMTYGTKNITIPARIIQHDTWRHALARKKFSIANATGNINKVSLRCANGLKEYPQGKLTKLSLPKRWSNCYVDIVGDTDTSFDLIEHPLN